jgi:hypothetical protein
MLNPFRKRADASTESTTIITDIGGERGAGPDLRDPGALS